MREKPYRKSLVILGLLLACGASHAQVSQRLVSANPHHRDILVAGGPMPAVAQLASIDANAYHVNTEGQMVALHGLGNFGKPTIYSTDAGAVPPADAALMIAKAKDLGAHFEYYDGYLNDLALAGSRVAGAATFHPNSRTVLGTIRDFGGGTVLAPNGVLSRNGSSLQWKPPGQPKQTIRLVGYSWMGPVATADDRVDFDQYLEALRSYKVNFTRIWLVEQWSAYATLASQPASGGYNPFGRNENRGSWDLGAVDQAFLNRLKQFVSKAWSRGIVVQVTLFDRHGMMEKNDGPSLGTWLGSPYNYQNNKDFTWNGQNLELFRRPAGCIGYAPQTFIQTGTGAVGTMNSIFIEAVTRSLDGYGNVIFEVMNEPVDRLSKNACNCCDWQAGLLAGWHDWVALKVKSAP